MRCIKEGMGLERGMEGNVGDGKVEERIEDS